MAWNNPTTWLGGAGNEVTSTKMNQQVRDNFKAIGDPWQSYTPQWLASTTNPAIVNGTIAGNYMQAGKLVLFRIRLVMGSTTTYGTGVYSFTLPVPAVVGLDNAIDCSVFLRDVSVGTRATRLAYLNNSTALVPVDAAGAQLGPSAPWTWQVGDIISITGSYEAA